MNAIFNKSQYWDGRAANLADQVVNSVMANPKAMLKTRGGPMPINPTEHAAAKQRAVEQFRGIPGYVAAFRQAFPEQSDPVAYDNIGRAIALFEATLITPDSPFDRWLKGDDQALSDAQKDGLKLFIEKGCATCHNGVNVGGGMYARFGVITPPSPEYLPPDDWGRFAVTKAIADKYAFKVPSLRNVELTAPYFHTGATYDLKKAVAVMGESQLGVALSVDETDKIVAFLNSLTGRQPEVVLPILPPRTAPPTIDVTSVKRLGVIPDARFARDREFRKNQSFAALLWIPDHAFGLPGMTRQANASSGVGMRRTRNAFPSSTIRS